MAQALSNLSLLLPLSSSGRTSNSVKPQYFRGVKAMAGEPRDNLDHLQRGPSKQHHQPPPKKRVAPAAPIGNYLLKERKSISHNHQIKHLFFSFGLKSELLFFYYFFLQDYGTGFQRRGQYSR